VLFDVSDLRIVPRAFLSEFIRSNPRLWKIKSKSYSDKNKQKIAYEQIRVKLSEIDPETRMEAVLKK
jgi:hypothetical protein